VLDLVVTGGEVVLPSGTMRVDIGVADGRVALIGSVGTLPDAERVIDADGKILIPGGIDPHCHTNWVVPTAAAEGIRCFPPEQVSLAAAYGGTTTLVDFAIWQPGDTLEDAVRAKEKEWSGSSFVDYSYHVAFKGDLTFDVVEQIGGIIRAGHPTFKIWMTNTTPSRPRQKTDVGWMSAILEQTARHGGMLAVHAEDDDLVMFQYQRLEHEGKWGYENIHLAHNKLSEALSFRRAIGLAEYLGAPIYLMHVSASEGVEAIREARAKGLPIYGETLQHYSVFTADNYREPDGAKYHTYPSLKGIEDVAAMWGGLSDGALSTVATDEMCTTRDVKLRGKTVDDVTGGLAGVEVRLAVVYTEAVAKRGLSLERYVDLTSANAAKILGMYPQKGVIAVGSDADLVLLDPNDKRTLAATDMHETDYSAWEGFRVEAWPAATILRGNVVVEGGALHGREGDGNLITRRISQEILSRPSC
jgi:dihydropyrimidinase